MKQAARLVALSIVAVAALTGCMRMQVNLELQPDDTVSGTMVLAVQEGVGESFGMSDEEVLAQISGENGPEIEGATVEEYAQDGFVGQKYTFEGQPLADIATEVGSDGLSITREGDTFVVDGPLDTGGQDTSELAGADVTISVTFPGKVTEHNGTLEGNTVTWDLLNSPDSIHAVGGAKAGASLPLWIIIAISAVVILGLIAVIGFLAWNARKKALAGPAEGAEVGEGAEPDGSDASTEPAFEPEPIEEVAVDEAVAATAETPVVEAEAPEIEPETPAEGEPEVK